MKVQFIIIAVSVVLFTTMIASLHTIDAATYEKQENFKYVKQKITEPLKGHPGWWKYLIKVCADDYSLAITEVVLSSDMEKVYQGVNKGIAKGKCSYYGAVMKAKDGNSLGYKITQTHEAVEKILDYKNGKPGAALSEVSRYRFILGWY